MALFSHQDIHFLDGLGQAELVRNGEVTPAELLDACIQRIQAMEPKINAFSSLDLQKARQTLSQCQPLSAQGQPFAFIPLATKDNISVPRWPLTYGSRIFMDHVGYEESHYVKNINLSGFIHIGKTNCSEFSLLPSTETLLRGCTHNPWNLKYSTGGSSGGAAAAVASGILPIAHANDVGGSIRIPAALCGVFGFKPSLGRHVATSHVKNGMAGLLSNHCITRSVRDSACFLDITEDKSNQARYAPIGFVKQPIAYPLKIGVHADNFMALQPDDSVFSALQRTANLCRDLGHEITWIDLPKLPGSEICDAYMLFAGATISDIAQVMQSSINKDQLRNLFEPFSVSLIEWYREQPKTDLGQAREFFISTAQKISSTLEKYDVLLSPTLLRESYQLSDIHPCRNYHYLVEKVKEVSAYTSIYNICGATAMSVPLEFSPAGLPIGMHFSAKAGQDKLLLQLAYQLENAKPWHQMWPQHSFKKQATGVFIQPHND